MPDWRPKLALMGENIVNLREQEVLADLDGLLAEGAPPWELMNCFNESLGRVGEMFQKGIYYMTGLILAG
ncbi:MAG: hypothetical protein LBE49_06730, partial [Deltaproteobacteria bacterium]|nr:hypothetical protein [Deltaproteobacteria bacterium]